MADPVQPKPSTPLNQPPANGGGALVQGGGNAEWSPGDVRSSLYWYCVRLLCGVVPRPRRGPCVYAFAISFARVSKASAAELPSPPIARSQTCSLTPTPRPTLPHPTPCSTPIPQEQFPGADELAPAVGAYERQKFLGILTILATFQWINAAVNCAGFCVDIQAYDLALGVVSCVISGGWWLQERNKIGGDLPSWAVQLMAAFLSIWWACGMVIVTNTVAATTGNQVSGVGWREGCGE